VPVQFTCKLVPDDAGGDESMVRKKALALDLSELAIKRCTLLQCFPRDG